MVVDNLKAAITHATIYDPVVHDGTALLDAIVQQVDGPMRFQIEQQRAIAALLLSQRDVIDAQNSRTTLFTFVDQGMQEVEQRIRADRYAGLTRQASAALAASLECEGGQQLGSPHFGHGTLIHSSFDASGGLPLGW